MDDLRISLKRFTNRKWIQCSKPSRLKRYSTYKQEFEKLGIYYEHRLIGQLQVHHS
jgi:hypothetical protein